MDNTHIGAFLQNELQNIKISSRTVITFTSKHMVLECYSLLKEIEPRPAMFTGEISLRSIHTYASGYYHALWKNKLIENNKPCPFHDWIADKLGYYE